VEHLVVLVRPFSVSDDECGDESVPLYQFSESVDEERPAERFDAFGCFGDGSTDETSA
jgi:hypothetical protein